MVKLSPAALNFGYDFVLLVHFLGHPAEQKTIVLNDDNIQEAVEYIDSV